MTKTALITLALIALVSFRAPLDHDAEARKKQIDAWRVAAEVGYVEKREAIELALVPLNAQLLVVGAVWRAEKDEVKKGKLLTKLSGVQNQMEALEANLAGVLEAYSLQLAAKSVTE